MSEPAPTNPARTLPLPLIIGLGNDQRSDDRSGLEVARALRPLLAGKARVEECESEGIALLVIDAVRSGAAPGTVHRLEPGDGFLPGFRSVTSTHGLSLAEAVALARGLGCLPRRLVVYGIEADDVRMGAELTPPVAHGVQEVTDRILAELEAEAAVGGSPD